MNQTTLFTLHRTDCIPQSSQSVPLSERVAKLEKELVGLRELVLGNQAETGSLHLEKRQNIPTITNITANRSSLRRSFHEASTSGISSPPMLPPDNDDSNSEDDVLQIESVRLNKRRKGDSDLRARKKAQRATSRVSAESAMDRSLELVAFEM
jgi:hypothetical protein